MIYKKAAIQKNGSLSIGTTLPIEFYAKKFLYAKLFCSQSIKSQAHVLTFYEFCDLRKILFDTRCGAKDFFDKLKLPFKRMAAPFAERAL